MKIDEILQIIYDLSMSQGCWGRLYRELINMKNSDSDEWYEFVDKVESIKFRKSLDVVLYFEQGELPSYYLEEHKELKLKNIMNNMNFSKLVDLYIEKYNTNSGEIELIYKHRDRDYMIDLFFRDFTDDEIEELLGDESDE